MLNEYWGATKSELVYGWRLQRDFKSEKIGGPERHASNFRPFTEMLAVCGMLELMRHGNEFTWAGKRHDFVDSMSTGQVLWQHSG